MLRYETSGFAVVRLSVPVDDKSKEDATPHISSCNSTGNISKSKGKCGDGHGQHESLPEGNIKPIRVPLSLIRYASSNSICTQSKQTLTTKLAPVSTTKLTLAKDLGQDLAARIEGYSSAGKFPVGVPLLFAGSSSKRGRGKSTRRMHSTRNKQARTVSKHTSENNQVESEGVIKSEVAGDQYKDQKDLATPAVRIRTRVYLWLSSLCFVVANGACREVDCAMNIFGHSVAWFACGRSVHTCDTEEFFHAQIMINRYWSLYRFLL